LIRIRNAGKIKIHSYFGTGIHSFLGQVFFVYPDLALIVDFLLLMYCSVNLFSPMLVEGDVGADGHHPGLLDQQNQEQMLRTVHQCGAGK